MNTKQQIVKTITENQFCVKDVKKVFREDSYFIHLINGTSQYTADLCGSYLKKALPRHKVFVGHDLITDIFTIYVRWS